MRAASGYLSGDPAQLHIGLPVASEIFDLEIDWGDGEIMHIEEIESNTHVAVTHSA
jgi:enediyne biosynthesis protein E4